MIRKIIATATLLCGLTACSVPGQNPAARPAPGDNQVKLEVEAVQITQNAVTTVSENIRVRVNASNGEGENLIGDDFKPLADWDSGNTSTIPGKPWTMVFSQAPGDGAGSIILGVRIYPKSGKIVSIKCHWFTKLSGATNWTEDKPKLQVGAGDLITCLYSIQFPI
jgi:hypothetical protein